MCGRYPAEQGEMTGYLSNLSLKEGKICHLSPEYWLCQSAGSVRPYFSCIMLVEFVIKRGKALSSVTRILALLPGQRFFSGQSTGMVQQYLDLGS